MSATTGSWRAFGVAIISERPLYPFGTNPNMRAYSIIIFGVPPRGERVTDRGVNK